MLGIFVISLLIPAQLATPPERDARIIGGKPALRGEFPHQVAILHSNGSMFCGGSIITKSIVLTAAHCTMKTPTNFKALAGSLSYIHYKKEDGQIREIIKVIRHEKYVNWEQGHDIALAKVAKPFVYNDFVKAIMLSKVYENEPCVACGWGMTVDGDRNSIPEFLRKVDLLMVLHDQCLKLWGRLPESVTCTLIPGRDTCNGDSGGALVQKVNKQLVQVGITSYGKECGNANFPGVYTTVSKYIDWIINNKAKLT